MKYIYILTIITLSLTGCLSAKISHKSEVKAATTDNIQKQAEAKVDEQTETHVREADIDTSVTLIGGSGSDTSKPIVVFSSSAGLVTYYPHAHPITATKSIKNATSTAIYYPETQRLVLSLTVRDTVIKVSEKVKETTISEHRTSDIDSSSRKKSATKTEVKGSTSVSLSAFQMPWMTWVYVIVALLVGIFIGKRIAKK